MVIGLNSVALALFKFFWGKLRNYYGSAPTLLYEITNDNNNVGCHPESFFFPRLNLE